MTPANLKKLRMSLGLTPKAIADKMSVSTQLIRKIEWDKEPVKESSLIFYELALKEERRKREYAREHRARSA